MEEFEIKPMDSAFDTATGTLTMPTGVSKLLRLRPVAPVTSDSIFVKVSDESVVKVKRSTSWSFAAPMMLVPPGEFSVGDYSFFVDYHTVGLKPGIALVEARTFDPLPDYLWEMERQWGSGRLFATLKIRVLGAEYSQSDSRWGNLVYGSANPAYKNVAWTTMAYAGCGPTALAMIMDFLTRNDDPANKVSPKEAMEYASKHGRAATPGGDPNGTDGNAMVSHLGETWPDYTGERVLSVADAIRLLRLGEILLFLCLNGKTYKHSADGKKEYTTWPGHYMVLWGVESNGRTFWISDPSLAKTKYIDLDQLTSHCTIWRIHKKST
jgi:hypothetical protein